MEPLLAALAGATGVGLVALSTVDIFLTILHPDRDGPASVALNRATWRAAVVVGRAFPRAAPELLAAAGGVMIAATIVLWMALYILGFALLAWPFLGTHFTYPEAVSLGFVDALYWSGVTFTTLGYGDVRPVTALWKTLAMLEAVAGFALVGAAVAFLLSVYQGIEQRDEMALRIFSETRRTWDGHVFVLRVLDEEGEAALLRHVETWADQMRRLHERLYRFQPLAFYVRTRSHKHHPERMLEAVGEVALAARVLSDVAGMEALRPAADEIDIAYTEFVISAVRHHGSARALRDVEAPSPTAEDRARVRALRDAVAAARAAPARGPAPEEANDEALLLAARIRVFLDELDRITRWRTLRGLGEP